MYGPMQFADFVVGYALQTLSRCLLKIGAREGMSLQDERLLAEHIGRLQSIWQMMQWSVGKVQYGTAAARLRDARNLLHAPVPELQAAEQLLDYADDKTRELLNQFAQRLRSRGPSNGPTRDRGVGLDIGAEASPGDAVLRAVAERRELLGCLLQEESAAWREPGTLRRINEADLLEHGVGRAYAKARRLNERFDAAANHGERPPGPKRIIRLRRWVSHATNHLDLLRPALGEGAKTGRWHLKRLESKLEQQLALELFSRAVVELELKPKSLVRLEELVVMQRRHLDKQRRKLAEGAFVQSPAGYLAEATAAVAQLGLQEIALLPMDVRAERTSA